jgi:hypothetical protein
MFRDALVAATLTEMTEKLAQDFDLVEYLTLLSNRAVQVLGVAAAGVMLLTPERELQFAAGSSWALRHVGLFEMQNEGGPSLDCAQTGVTITNRYMQTGSSRWPAFAAEATEAGYWSTHVLPIRLRFTTLGVLNLFSVAHSKLSGSDRAAAQSLADLATLALLQSGAATNAPAVARRLELALSGLSAVEQAKGIVAQRAAMDVEQALDELQQYSERHDAPLLEVARAIVDGTITTVVADDPRRPDTDNEVDPTGPVAARP